MPTIITHVSVVSVYVPWRHLRQQRMLDVLL